MGKRSAEGLGEDEAVVERLSRGGMRALYEPDDAGKIGEKFLVRFECFHFLVHDGVTID